MEGKPPWRQAIAFRPRNLRIRIEALADGRCEYCHAPQHACGYHFHLEHIAPLIQGGTDELSNRALAT